MTKPVLTFRVDEDLYPRMKAYSDVVGRSMAAILNDVMREHLAQVAADPEFEAVVMADLVRRQAAFDLLREWVAAKEGATRNE